MDAGFNIFTPVLCEKAGAIQLREAKRKLTGTLLCLSRAQDVQNSQPSS